MRVLERASQLEAPRPARPVCDYFDIKVDPQGREYMEVYLTGIALLRLVLTNKGTAFDYEERRALGLDGLLPPAVNTLEQQVERAYRGLNSEPTPLLKYQFLRALQERQEVLFFALLERHLTELLPIVYTPTVGDAVKQFSSLYQTPRGVSLSPLNIGRAESVMASFTMNDVRMIVATDSSAILGIGDQGYGGLAIPIGKLALYTAVGGVAPYRTMPVSLDIGSERADLLEDPFYLGVPHRRLRGDEYLSFTDRFVEAVKHRWPDAIIQWEDLAKDTAFTVLERYRKVLPSFNDDIQGTGAVALAGVTNACRMLGQPLRDQRIVIHGAGAGGVGVAWAMREGLVRDGLGRDEASARIYVIDSKGLITSAREMEGYKRPYAQPDEVIQRWGHGASPSLLETVRQVRPTVLLGLSGQAGAFSEEVVREMAASCLRPIIFPLSNPTTNAEALPEDVLRWTEGRALVAAGSPFAPAELGGKTYPVGQGNNAFIFPGLGFGTMLSGAREVTDQMVLEASAALSDYLAERHADDGRVYPPVDELKEVAVRVAARVMRQAVAEKVATVAVPDQPGQIESFVRSELWKPRYLPVVRGQRKPEGSA